MGIKRQYGAGAAARAEVAAGQARAGEEAARLHIAQQEAQASRAFQAQKIREQLQHQDAVRQMNMQWDLEKESRARAWEIEKLETASRIDNEIENKRYIKYMSQYQTGQDEIDKIRKEGNHPEAAIQMMEYSLNKQFADKLPEAAARLGLGLYEIEQRKAKGKLGFDLDRDGIDPSNKLGLDIDVKGTYTVPPTTQARQLEAENKFRVISPNGEEEIIEGGRWTEYKEKGYILADIAELRRKTQRPSQKDYNMWIAGGM